MLKLVLEYGFRLKNFGSVGDLLNHTFRHGLDFSVVHESLHIGLELIINPVSYTHLTLPTILLV